MSDSPITVEELQRRGVVEEIEGRALDVVLRLGWPRPGDPLGMRPCLPVPVDEVYQLRAELMAKGAAAVQQTVSILTRWTVQHDKVRVLYEQTAEAAEEQ